MCPKVTPHSWCLANPGINLPNRGDAFRGAAATVLMIASPFMLHSRKQLDQRELSRPRDPMLHLCLVVLVAIITPNVIAIAAIAALIRRDLARGVEP